MNARQECCRYKTLDLDDEDEKKIQVEESDRLKKAIEDNTDNLKINFMFELNVKKGALEKLPDFIKDVNMLEDVLTSTKKSDVKFLLERPL